jgi:hypothetical protein
MKKVILSVLTIAALNYSASAQSNNGNNKLSIGAELAIPTGNLSLIQSLGYGGSIQGEFVVAKSLALTGSAGYLTFAYKKEIKAGLKEAGIELDNQAGIPVKAGAKYYFGKLFYGAAELGASFSTSKDAGTAFVYAPTVGINLPISDKNNLDLGVRYESWSYEGASSFIGIRAAYAFGL